MKLFASMLAVLFNNNNQKSRCFYKSFTYVQNLIGMEAADSFGHIEWKGSMVDWEDFTRPPVWNSPWNKLTYVDLGMSNIFPVEIDYALIIFKGGIKIEELVVLHLQTLKIIKPEPHFRNIYQHLVGWRTKAIYWINAVVFERYSGTSHGISPMCELETFSGARAAV